MGRPSEASVCLWPECTHPPGCPLSCLRLLPGWPGACWRADLVVPNPGCGQERCGQAVSLRSCPTLSTGDYFGILKEARVTTFPFNVLDNPMYWGSTANYLGWAVM